MKKPTTKTMYLISEIYEGKMNDYQLCETCTKLVLNDLFDQKYIEKLIDFQGENGCYYSIEQIITILTRNIFLNNNDFGKTIKNDDDLNYRSNEINTALTTISEYCKENH